jgi:hypothetical protein
MFPGYWQRVKSPETSAKRPVDHGIADMKSHLLEELRRTCFSHLEK